MTEETKSPAAAAEFAPLVRAAVTQYDLGKITFLDIVKAGMGTVVAPAENAVAAPPKPVTLTEEHRAALKRLPEVYGQVAPTEIRDLTPSEQRDLLAERETIDTLLTLLKKRKDEGIREAIAFHLDALAKTDVEAGEIPEPDRDAKGHFLVKQDVEVDGTGKKFQRTVSDPAPTMPSAADLLAAQEAGRITREQYLALTSIPDVPRVFDEQKARKAIGKDPSLLLVLSELAKPGKRVATIKVEKA